MDRIGLVGSAIYMVGVVVLRAIYLTASVSGDTQKASKSLIGSFFVVFVYLLLSGQYAFAMVMFVFIAIYYAYL